MFIFLFVFDKDICYFLNSEDGNTIKDSDVSIFHFLGIKFITTFLLSVDLYRLFRSHSLQICQCT